MNSSNLAQMSLNAEKMESVEPVTVTIRSGHEPSLMLILAPLSSRNLLTISPFLPMMLPTSFPCINSLIDRDAEGPSDDKGLFSMVAMLLGEGRSWLGEPGKAARL